MWLLLLYLWLKTCNESRSWDTINECSFLGFYNWSFFLIFFVVFWYIYWLIIFLYVTSISLNRNDRKTKHTSKRKLMKSCLVWSMYINLHIPAFNCNLQLMQINKKCVLIVRMQQQLPYRPTRWIIQLWNVDLYL